jgi:hypothetical protein
MEDSWVVDAAPVASFCAVAAANVVAEAGAFVASYMHFACRVSLLSYAISGDDNTQSRHASTHPL